MGGLHIAHEVGQFAGLQAEGRVRSAVGARQRKVLLDQAGAERDGCRRHGRAHGVIGEADGHAEGCRQMRDGREMASAAGAG